MDPLSTLTKIRKIISNTADRELVKLILDLQKEIFAIESRNLELASELASLKPRLDLPGKDAYTSTIRLLLSGGGQRSFLSQMLGEPGGRNSPASARIGGR
jgi:hypothetical protein